MKKTELNKIVRKLVSEKVYHFKNNVTGAQLDLTYDKHGDAKDKLDQLGNKRWSMKEIARMLKEDSDYQEFFRDALRKFGAKTPAEMDDEQKKKFFNYIDSEWKTETNESKVIRKEMNKIFEEIGLTKKFSRIVSNFHSAQKEIQDAEKAMDAAKKKFLKDFKGAKEDATKEKIKKAHIVNMKKLAADLKKKTLAMQSKIRDSEIDFNNAIETLAVPAEADLLEGVTGDVTEVQLLATLLVHTLLLAGKENELKKYSLKWNKDKILNNTRADYKGVLVTGEVPKLQDFIGKYPSEVKHIMSMHSNRLRNLKMK